MGWIKPFPAANPTDGTQPVVAGRIRGSAMTTASLTFTELVASTGEAWGGFQLTLQAVSLTGGFGALAIGPVGAEVVIANFQINRYSSFAEYFFPIPIPAGTRISFAYAGATTVSCAPMVVGYPATLFQALPGVTTCDCGPFELSGSSASYGFPVKITPPATANTKSAWTEVSQLSFAGNRLQGNSLLYQYKYLGLAFVNWFTPFSADNWLSIVDVAYGAAGSEVPFVENLPIRAATSGANLNTPPIFWIPWNRPAGDRISWRIQYSTTTAPATGLFLYGLR